MAKTFYQTRKGINIVLSDKYHFHENISEDMLYKIVNDMDEYINASFDKKEDCVIEYDFNYPIGVTHCIETDGNDGGIIYYKCRGNRKYMSRMIRGVYPQECSYVTTILRLIKGKYYLILTSWIGRIAKPELGNISFFDQQADPYGAVCESARFWLNHALIDDEPTAEELAQDAFVIFNNEYDQETVSTHTLSLILNRRLNRTDIDLPVSMELNSENLAIWLDDNLNLNSNESFCSRKNYLESKMKGGSGN